MKFLKIILLLSILLVSANTYSQESTNIPERTPEQEAAKQTEKLQQELDLSSEQARQVHEINLKYARARKVSNTRIEAIQRIKDKEVELSRILNEQQQSILHNKRYERSSFQSTENRQGNQAIRQSSESRTQISSRPANGSATQRTEQQLETSRSYTQPSTTRQAVPTRSYPSGETRSTFRNPSDERSSSVRSAAPANRTTPRTSSNSSSSSSRSSSTNQQPSSSGRR